MIINCPIYLEIDERFTPEEGREFTLGIRKLIKDQLASSTGGVLRVRDDKGRIRTIKILSEKQAVDRFAARITKVNSSPPEEGSIITQI